jgi:hypothetical protein
MPPITPKQIIKEIIWWIVSALAVYIAVTPYFHQIDFKHLYFNVLIIMITIHFFRYIMFFRQNIILSFKWSRFFGFGLLLLLAIYIARTAQVVLISLEDVDLDSISHHVYIKNHFTSTEAYRICSYLKNEILILSVAAFTMTMGLLARIVYSHFGFGTERMKNFLHSSSERLS